MACNIPDCGECYNCQSNCDSCQGGCQSCQTCDTCQTCDKCMSDCNAGGQALYDGQTLSSICDNSFSFSVPPRVNGIIGPNQNPEDNFFNKAIWDEIADWLSERNSLPVGYDGEEDYTVSNSNSNGGDTVRASYTSDVSPFSANEFNRIADIVNYSNVSTGDIIYASLFQDLETYANNMEVDNGACKYCVTECDLTHDKCITCDTSQCSTYCQSCNTTCNGCNTCDEGECCDNCEGACEDCNSCVIGEDNSCATGEDDPCADGLNMNPHQ